MAGEGRVNEVERLMQVVQVLRAAEGRPVLLSALASKVTEYADPDLKPEALKRKVFNDRKRLGEIGFAVEQVAPEGSEGAFVLKDGQWRLPLELSPMEEGVLQWVMAAAGAVVAEEGAEDLSGLVGRVPRELDLAQAAIAGGRRLVVERDDGQAEFEPGLLASRGGRWFVLGRWVGETDIKGPRLDRLDLTGLGGPVDLPLEVGDPEEVLDPTAWRKHEPREAELRCRAEDLDVVRSWFPRGTAERRADGTVAIGFAYRNEESLVDRVLGLAGAAWVVAPSSAVEAIRARVDAVLEAARA